MWTEWQGPCSVVPSEFSYTALVQNKIIKKSRWLSFLCYPTGPWRRSHIKLCLSPIRPHTLCLLYPAPATENVLPFAFIITSRQKQGGAENWTRAGWTKWDHWWTCQPGEEYRWETLHLTRQVNMVERNSTSCGIIIACGYYAHCSPVR